MTKIIVSFGFRHHFQTAPAESSGDTVIDVRSLFGRNPYHDKKLRKLRGTDKAVQDDILKTPYFAKKYMKLKEQVVAGTEIVWLGCTGGHHRSVFLAELLAKELNAEVQHLDFHKK